MATDNLLQPAAKTQMFAKFGLLGLPKSGKTFTACHLAAGIATRTGKKKPVGFFDTEGGSDYIQHLYEKAGIGLLVVKSRSFADLVGALKEAEQSCCALVIDSITHPWVEICETYLAKINQDRAAKKWNPIDKLEFQHWQYIKKEWRTRFTEPYLNSHIHIFMCGRLGWEYEFQENERGKRELVKGDIKMKTEAELGYEPSVLIEMERIFDGDGKLQHKATVLGDRFNLMDGQVFLNPKFPDFDPLWKQLHIGGETLPAGQAVDAERNSADMLQTPGLVTEDRRMQHKILTEEIEGLLTSAFPGQSKDEKKAKADILQVAFASRSWTAICDLPIETLKQGREITQGLCYVLVSAAEQGITVPAGTELLPWLESQKQQFVGE